MVSDVPKVVLHLTDGVVLILVVMEDGLRLVIVFVVAFLVS